MNEELIEICKREIAYAADYACLKWSQDDLISIHEDGLGDVVFLWRFNPREQIDESGNVVMRDGKPVMTWLYTMWLEREIDKPTLEWDGQIGDKVTFKYNMPRLICPTPWLVRIVTLDGQIEGRINAILPH